MTAVRGFFQREGFKNYLASLRYALFTMRRPLVGFWDLIHERKGSMAAAHTIVALMVIVQVLRLTATNFQFILVHMEYLNVIFVAAQILVPLGLWVVAHWALTTLFDGKGRMRDIYMGTAYAMTPMVLINAFLIPMSHVLTAAEGTIYWMLMSIATFWFAMLMLCASMMIQSYTMSKTVLAAIGTLVAIAVMVFVFSMFFSVVSDAVAYFISLYRELMFRFRR